MKALSTKGARGEDLIAENNLISLKMRHISRSTKNTHTSVRMVCRDEVILFTPQQSMPPPVSQQPGTIPPGGGVVGALKRNVSRARK